MGTWNRSVTPGGAPRMAALDAAKIAKKAADAAQLAKDVAAQKVINDAAYSAEMQKFLKAPIHYMQVNVVKPSGGDLGAGKIVGGRLDVADRIIDSTTDKPTIGRIQMPKGNIDHIRFIPTQGYINGKVTASPDAGSLPIYFLPWRGGDIVDVTIPYVPSNLAEWDDSEYPRFFFTAALNGCSVFVKPGPTGITVYHAGVGENSSIQGDTDKFWADQMVALGSGFDKEKLATRISKVEYMNKGPAAQKYLDWLNAKDPNAAVTVEIRETGACVFGIRFGRAWTFYLQQHAVTQRLRIVGKNAVNIGKGLHGATYAPKSGAGTVTKLPPAAVSGPFGFLRKAKDKYQIAEMTSATPLTVREIYPKNSQHVAIPPTFQVNVT